MTDERDDDPRIEDIWEELADAWARNNPNIEVLSWDDYGIHCHDEFYEENYSIDWGRVRRELT